MIENIENPLMIFTAAIRKLFLPFNFALLLSVNKIQFSSEKAGCKKFERKIMIPCKIKITLLGVFIMAINEIATDSF